MRTKSRFILLTHPKEHRKQKTGTGRLARLNLAACEILPGIAFDDHPRVRELIRDSSKSCFLLYPGPEAIDLGAHDPTAEDRLRSRLKDRDLVVFLIDATWACAKAVLRESPSLSRLPRLGFEPREPSRWIIKRQPHDYCLSTIEAIHELLCALDAAGMDHYPDRRRLLEAFASMQDYQIRRANEGGAPRFLRP